MRQSRVGEKSTCTLTLSFPAYKTFKRLTSYRRASQTELIERLSQERYVRYVRQDYIATKILYPSFGRVRSLDSVTMNPETISRLNEIGAENLVYGQGPSRVLDAILSGQLVLEDTTLDQIAQRRGPEVPLRDGPYSFNVSLLARAHLRALAGSIHPSRWLDRVARIGPQTTRHREYRSLSRPFYKLSIQKATCLWLASQAEIHKLRPHQKATPQAFAGLALEALGQGAIVLEERT